MRRNDNQLSLKIEESPVGAHLVRLKRGDTQVPPYGVKTDSVLTGLR